MDSETELSIITKKHNSNLDNENPRSGFQKIYSKITIKLFDYKIHTFLFFTIYLKFCV